SSAGTGRTLIVVLVKPLVVKAVLIQWNFPRQEARGDFERNFAQNEPYLINPRAYVGLALHLAPA
ncbi:MAG: hypothetical protein ABL883_09795, partial [Terricaulis sp.]